MSNLRRPAPTSDEGPVSEALSRLKFIVCEFERLLALGVAEIRDAIKPAHPAPLMTIAQVAEYLGVSERGAWELVAAGEIPRIRVSARVVRFRQEDVDAYVRRVADRMGR